MPNDSVRAQLQAALRGWAVAEINGEQARVVSVPALEHFAALADQLPQPCNLHWGCDAQQPYVVRATLHLDNQSREGMAQAGTLDDARLLALAQAMQFFGATLQEHWVEYDPEDGPNTAELPELGGAALGELLPAQEYSEYIAPSSDPQMDAARSHIDQLMEQLRGGGMGKQAAIVIARHGGGYGKDVEESRAIYKELKALKN